MTDKEKLEKAINFIEKIEKINFPTYELTDIVSLEGECDDCGSDNIGIIVKGTSEFIDPKDIEALRDEAWHVLAELKY